MPSIVIHLQVSRQRGAPRNIVIPDESILSQDTSPNWIIATVSGGRLRTQPTVKIIVKRSIKNLVFGFMQDFIEAMIYSEVDKFFF